MYYWWGCSMSLEIRRLSKETKEEQQNIKDYIQAVLKRR